MAAVNLKSWLRCDEPGRVRCHARLPLVQDEGVNSAVLIPDLEVFVEELAASSADLRDIQREVAADVLPPAVVGLAYDLRKPKHAQLTVARAQALVEVPQLKVLPMGWSWSSHFYQTASCLAQLTSASTKLLVRVAWGSHAALLGSGQGGSYCWRRTLNYGTCEECVGRPCLRHCCQIFDGRRLCPEHWPKRPDGQMQSDRDVGSLAQHKSAQQVCAWLKEGSGLNEKSPSRGLAIPALK